jgi:hypothetical protein
MSLAYRAAHVRKLDFKPKGVARHHWLSEAHILDPGKQRYFTPVDRLRQDCDSSYLSQCLDLQNSGHERIPRKMAGEEGLIDRDLFNADCMLLVEFQDPVDEQKWRAVGNNLHYLLN